MSVGVVESGVGADRVALTMGQRARLIYECTPLLVALGLLAGALLLRDDLSRVRLAIILAIIVAMLIGGSLSAVNRLRDLRSGAALVATDTLHGKFRSGQRLYGQFASLGRLRLIGRASRDGVRGSRYRVHYSPHSRVVWRLDAPR